MQEWILPMMIISKVSDDFKMVILKNYDNNDNDEDNDNDDDDNYSGE